MPVSVGRETSANADRNSQTKLLGNQNEWRNPGNVRTKILISVVGLLAGISIIL